MEHQKHSVLHRVLQNKKGEDTQLAKTDRKRTQGEIDATALRILYQHLSEEVILSVGDISDPHNLWTEISNIYASDDQTERNRVREYLFNSPGNTALQKINNFDVNQKRYTALGGDLNSEDKVNLLLRCAEHFLVDTLKQQLRLYPEIRDYDRVLKEMRIIADMIDNKKAGTNKNQFKISSRNNSNIKKDCRRCGRNNHLTQNCTSKTYCFPCKSNTHWYQNCNANKQNVANVTEPETMQKPKEKSEQNSDPNRELEEFTAVAETLNNSNIETKKQQCILDTGASSHCFPMKWKHLAVKTYSVSPKEVKVVGGTILNNIRSDFKIQLDTGFILNLKNVMPLENTEPLISVSQLLKAGARMKTAERSLCFFNSKDIIFLQAHQQENNIFKSKFNFLQKENIMMNESNIFFYHKLFGHISPTLLNKTLDFYGIKKMPKTYRM
eukprot:snap_masked-scaffold_16-processed-gene-4.22-mRNA-1 protein AED:1.00 eAED:1.00 QI:0/0/0/0/1/1/2/0/439